MPIPPCIWILSSATNLPTLPTVYLAARTTRIRELRTGVIPYSQEVGSPNFLDNPNMIDYVVRSLCFLVKIVQRKKVSIIVEQN